MATGELIVRGDLAESWDQPDPTTYVFKLRRGVKWHNLPPVNGRELVADDVICSFRRQIELKTNAGALGGLAKYEAPDKYTLKLTIDQPDADYLFTLASGWNKIVAREAVDANGDLKNGPTIGTGPFVMEKWEPNSVTTFRKNPDYFLKGVPYIDRLEFPRIKDDQARLASFRAKQISAAGPSLTPKDGEDLKKQVPDAQVIRVKSAAPSWEVGMNKRAGPTADKRVRQAVSKALDRQTLIDTALLGGGWLMGHFYLPGVDYVLPEDELKRLYARDVASAKQLLTQAGFPEGFDIDLAVLNTGAAFVSLGELVAAQLAEAGIRAKIRLVENVEYSDKILIGNEYQMYVGATTTIGTTNLDLFTRFHSKGARRGQTLDDPKLDQLIEQQRALKDVNQRKQLLLEIQRYLITDLVPSAQINGTLGTEVVQGNVRDITFGLPNPAYDEYAFLWLDA